MGGQVSKLMGKIFGTKEMRILMLGLDAAGKTSKSAPLNRVTSLYVVEKIREADERVKQQSCTN